MTAPVPASRVPGWLDSLQQGLVWVHHTGRVLHANPQAVCSTGVRTGDRLSPGELLRAVVQAVHHRVARDARLTGRPQATGDLVPQLLCRVLPGTGDDDALIVLGTAQHEPALDSALLMRLLGDDLDRPLRRAQQALSIAREEGDAHATAGLLDEMEGLLGNLARLVELATLWGQPCPPAQDRLDLMGLLREAWGEVADLAHERAVRLSLVTDRQAQTLVPVYGHGPALRRVLRDCMAAALRKTTPGGSLRIEHRQMGPRVQIVFVDCALFPDLPIAERPPARARDSHCRGREQVAWHLCRRLLALHGGQMREEHESGARNFMIDLPCGAPFPADNSASDMAQAHRYAHDLAALMARARRQDGGSAAAASAASRAAPSMSDSGV